MNGTTTQPAAKAAQKDAGVAARALSNAQTLLRDLRREAVELPVKLGEAQTNRDVQAITALHERRRALPASVHLARMSALAAGIDACEAELAPLKEAEAQLVKEITELQEQTRALQARLKDANERLLPVRQQVNGMESLIERKAWALNAEQEYMRSPEAADDPTASVWAMLPDDPSKGLQALIAQIKALRTTSIEDEAHTGDDARLRAVLDEASGAFRGDGAGIPAGDQQTLLEHLREELALILQ